RRIDPAGGTRTRPTLRPSAVLQAISARRAVAVRGACVLGGVVCGAADRGLDEVLGHEARPGVAPRHPLGPRPDLLREGAPRDRGQRAALASSRIRAPRNPLPADAR